mmetsp:Transcript_80552/g.224124  ORF Transcript_80552/g.224124 Transcript_80552/m.224124 type:complete len:405 (-) Transcript_80552:359-1573(-)
MAEVDDPVGIAVEDNASISNCKRIHAAGWFLLHLHKVGATALVQFTLAAVRDRDIEHALEIWHSTPHHLGTHAVGTVHADTLHVLDAGWACSIDGLPELGVRASQLAEVAVDSGSAIGAPRVVTAHNVVQLWRADEAEGPNRSGLQDSHPVDSGQCQRGAALTRVSSDDHESPGLFLRRASARDQIAVSLSKLGVQRVGDFRGVCFPLDRQHVAEGIHELDTVVALGVVGGGNHDANGLAIKRSRPDGCKDAHPVHDVVKQLGFRPEPCRAIPQFWQLAPRMAPDAERANACGKIGLLLRKTARSIGPPGSIRFRLCLHLRLRLCLRFGLISRGRERGFGCCLGLCAALCQSLPLCLLLRRHVVFGEVKHGTNIASVALQGCTNPRLEVLHDRPVWMALRLRLA